jgi:hypothetical protein
MSQTLLQREPAHKRHAELRKRLRRRALGKLDDAAWEVAAQPPLPRWVGWLSRLLAAKLTADRLSSQVPEQVLRIMVNSLLEDLRVTFRDKGLCKK